MLKTFAKFLRPAVKFDPSNVEHRKCFKKFLQTNSWKSCPYIFIIDDNSVDVVHYINRVLVEYYIKQDQSLVAKPKEQKGKVVKLKRQTNE